VSKSLIRVNLTARTERQNPTMKITLDLDHLVTERTDLDPNVVIPEALRRMADDYVKTIEGGDEGASLTILGSGGFAEDIGDWYIES
jgi:hypothetical protein